MQPLVDMVEKGDLMANARDWREGASVIGSITNFISTVIETKFDKLLCKINSRDPPYIEKTGKPSGFRFVL